MQKLAKNDIIILSHVGKSGQLLHRTQSGYQFGYGPDTQIVTSPEQVADFDPHVQAEVAAWLNRGGVKVAEQALLDKEISESASELPGTLDALAEKLGPEMKAGLYRMMMEALGLKGSVPQGGEVRQEIGGGELISRPDGSREFIPAGVIEDEKAPEFAAVGVGAGAEDGDEEDSVLGQIEVSKKANKRRK